MKLRDAETVSGIENIARNYNNFHFNYCSFIAASITFFTACLLNKDVPRIGVYLPEGKNP